MGYTKDSGTKVSLKGGSQRWEYLQDLHSRIWRILYIWKPRDSHWLLFFFLFTPIYELLWSKFINSIYKQCYTLENHLCNRKFSFLSLSPFFLLYTRIVDNLLTIPMLRMNNWIYSHFLPNYSVFIYIR